MKKIKLRYLYGFFSAIVLLSACSKDDILNDENNKSYYIKFTVDGAEKKFEYNAVGLLNASEDGSSYASILGAGKAADTKKNNIAILLGTKNKVSAGNKFTFADPLPAGCINPETLLLAYNDETGTDFGDPGGSLTEFIYNAKPNVIISFTEIGNGFIKGSFSGNVYHRNEQTAEVTRRVIEHGEFYLETQP